MTTNPQKGKVLGNYELKKKVGTGGFGLVWLAEDKYNGQQVALKIPRHDRVSETLLDKYVNRELQALKEIRTIGGHPNLMNLQDTVSNKGDVILVVGFVSGDELGEVVDQRGGLDAKQARNIGIDICDAMSFMHQHDFIYRDLKPDNIILDGQQNPTIIDFTTAKKIDPSDLSLTSGNAVPDDLQTVIGAGGGSIFKPPEVTDSKNYGDQGPWSDVYSIGKILFFMITNQRLGTNGLAPSDVGGTSPSYLDDIVERATAEEPSNRYSNATALKDALERKDPSPPQMAKLYHVGSDEMYEIESGDTIGNDRPPKTNVTIDLDYVSGVHCRLSRDATGTWRVKDESTNGTYYYQGDDWVELLSPNGRQELRSKGHTVEATTDTIQINEGDSFRLVDPNYDDDSWFIFEGEKQ